MVTIVLMILKCMCYARSVFETLSGIVGRNGDPNAFRLEMTRGVWLHGMSQHRDPNLHQNVFSCCDL